MPSPILPPLPFRNTEDVKAMQGPTPWSNWVIPRRVIAGAFPASYDDEETARTLTCLLELGVDTFVCLQKEVDIHVPEHVWRARQALRPYLRDAKEILTRAVEDGNPRITQQKIDFLHLAIPDGSITGDNAMHQLAEDCCQRVLNGEKLYIHCWGGHGRTGTLVSTMLGRLYRLQYHDALQYCQLFHDCRQYHQNVRSPQTHVQRSQVRRLLSAPSAVQPAIRAYMTPARPALAPCAADVSNSGCRPCHEETLETVPEEDPAASPTVVSLERAQSAAAGMFSAGNLLDVWTMGQPSRTFPASGPTGTWNARNTEPGLDEALKRNKTGRRPRG